MSQSDLDKNFPATPYKLEKAREKGQVSKSPDVVAVVVFVSAVIFLTWQGWFVCRELFRLDQSLLIRAARMEITHAALWSLIEHMVRATLVLTAPFFVLLMIAAILGNTLQTGPTFSFHPIKPDWTRISPATGFKRVFSMRTLFMGVRALLKLCILGPVVYFALKAMLPQFYHLADLSPLGLIRTLFSDLASLGLKISLALGLIALIDLMYTRHAFNKKMRMSKREIKDEIKHREGDPRIRARIRALRIELLKRSLALRRTRDADVLITNPTHVAVALKYEHGQMTSPLMLAKGKGFMAAAMRQIAARHHIPVVQNPSLARALYKDLPVNQHVPEEMYAQVARIIVWIFARRDALRARQTSPQEAQKVGKSANQWAKGGAWTS